MKRFYNAANFYLETDYLKFNEVSTVTIPKNTHFFTIFFRLAFNVVSKPGNSNALGLGGSIN